MLKSLVGSRRKRKERRLMNNFQQVYLKENETVGRTLRSFEKIILTSILDLGIYLNTEAKRCFATHDEDNDYFNMRIYIYYFNRMRIY